MISCNYFLPLLKWCTYTVVHSLPKDRDSILSLSTFILYSYYLVWCHTSMADSFHRVCHLQLGLQVPSSNFILELLQYGFCFPCSTKAFIPGWLATSLWQISRLLCQWCLLDLAGRSEGLSWLAVTSQTWWVYVLFPIACSMWWETLHNWTQCWWQQS